MVLKLFGDKPSPGLLSFPLAGATLALDFPNKGERHAPAARPHGRVVLAAGGRLYPAKDATMSGAAFRAGYPRVAQGRGTARSGHHVRLLAAGDRGGRMSKTILILGATSAIAQAYARRRAAQGASLHPRRAARRDGSRRSRPISRRAARAERGSGRSPISPP